MDELQAAKIKIRELESKVMNLEIKLTEFKERPDIEQVRLDLQALHNKCQHLTRELTKLDPEWAMRNEAPNV